jgi:two-component system chemotaxis response regulator CheB
MNKKQLTVLVVDDSAVVRQIIQQVLSTEPGILVDTSADPMFALRKMEKSLPDVVITDLEMPRMSGIEFIRKVMQEHPLPIIVCSGLAEKGTSMALQAMDLGAVEIITKPKVGIKDFLHESAVVLIDAVYGAAQSRLRRSMPPVPPLPGLSADVILPFRLSHLNPSAGPLIVLGASTGGVEALTCILRVMPADAPPILIAQHMPEHFTHAFAERLNLDCAIEVHEAKDGQRLRSGMALIAPGNHHLLVRSDVRGYFAEIDSGPLVSRHRPSVDVLFRSAACVAGENAIGVILTGMGDDGSKGLLEMRHAGAHTIAEAESSCVVFGMPREAVQCGAVKSVLSLPKIAPAILDILHARYG